MKLDDSIFKIDAAAYVERLCEFIRERCSTLHRAGVLVPFSGGVDSSTVLLLCARAVGTEQVTALLMPEMQGNPAARRYSHLVAKQFKIGILTRNISSVLLPLGTYSFILSVLPFRQLQDWATRSYMKAAGQNPFLQIVQGKASGMQRKGFAKYNSKQRVRTVVEYLVAEEKNYLVAGSAHKSEDLLGLYVKFGVDDSADIMPLKNLYRAHTLQLAAFLGVPGPILERTPNPDIIPGVEDKYLDILGLPSAQLDLLLYGIEHGMEDGDIAGQLALPLGKVQEIHDLVQQTEHMRSPSQSLCWEGIQLAETEMVAPESIPQERRI
jgi:NAD+ synthase